MELITEENECKEINKKINQIILSYNKPFEGSLESKIVTFYVLDNHEFVGGLAGAIYGDYFEKDLLAVLKEYRHSGIGRKLIDKAEAYARDANCKKMIVYTTSYQRESFYPKFNFRLNSKIENYPIEGINLLCYIKTL